MKIGILREYKSPEDVRVALTPEQCSALLAEHQNLEIVVEPYAKRCFNDEEYQEAGIKLSEDLSDCDVLIGVKEVPKERLIPNKVYFFFSHTIKKQDYNLDLMRELLERKISMIDHETLTDSDGKRIIGFGRWAGIVGAHYALLMMGKKSGKYELKPASQCKDMEEMLSQYKGKQWPAQKIALTGKGRVGKGAIEILEAAGIEEVKSEDFKNKKFDKAVYTVLDIEDLYQKEDESGPVDVPHFFKNPKEAKNAFNHFFESTDVLINGMFWDFRAPALFTLEDMLRKEFNIKIISDITCDVEGSVPITLRQTAIEDPYIGIDPKSGKETKPFTANSIDVMAVGNLPNELPRDASNDFGESIRSQVVPELFRFNESELLQNAMICHEGKFMPKFSYLESWAKG